MLTTRGAALSFVLGLCVAAAGCRAPFGGICMSQSCGAGLHLQVLEGGAPTLAAGELTFTLTLADDPSAQHQWSCLVDGAPASLADCVYEAEIDRDPADFSVIVTVEGEGDDATLWIRALIGPDAAARWTGPEALEITVTRDDAPLTMTTLHPDYDVIFESEACGTCESASQALDLAR
ncbi:MAG: hypothetical protein KC636_03920 [Myxococcales bacterium]|nr:hypothetical protein [Myxococcales bacterium]